MFEIVRIVLLLVMLGVASYFDIKHREVSDKHWLIFGISGIGMYLVDWQEHTAYDGLTIIFILALALMMWRILPIGKADILAFVCIGLLVPTMMEFVMVPLAVIAGAAIFAGITTISYNVILNTKDGICMRRNPFHTFDESFIRKSFAFFMIHKKRGREKFSICSENMIHGKRKFNLGIKNVESEFVAKQNDVFVECGTPMIPYMFVMYVLLVFINF